MAHTFTQIYIQIVFSVTGRHCLIHEHHRDEIEKYISGVVRNIGQKLITIYCMPDHVHMFIGMKPDIALSALVRDIKANSSRFINESRWIRGQFSWQEGFGAFSYSINDIDVVARYILHQQDHHKRKSFHEEYVELLKEFNVLYEDRKLFRWIE
jgi:REP element-mobilizing transposase RayT